MCLEGEGSIAYDGGTINYKLGDSILIPNALNAIILNPLMSSKFLEVKIPLPN